jgi:glutaredoxin
MAGLKPILLWGRSKMALLVIFLIALSGYIAIVALGKQNFFKMMVPEVSLFSNKSTMVEYYSMEGCPHCVRFNSEWEKFENEAKSNGITTHRYDARKDAEKVQQAGVEGFPTVMITKNGQTHTYEGARKADALMAEVKK